jgi:hypothetical protein
MKQVNDKFGYLMDYERLVYLTINVVDKIGKDGQHFLSHQITDDIKVERNFNDSNLVFNLETLKNQILKTDKLFKNPKGYLVTIHSAHILITFVSRIEENNYDDYLEIYEFSSFNNISVPYKTENLQLKNGDVVEKCTDAVFFYDIDSVLNYLEYNDILHYSSKEQISDSGFEDFLARSSHSGLEKHQFKDFSGTFDDLDYCIKNNLAVEDFDEWQAVQRMIKHKIDWETAKAISNKLYEKDISVFDCE